MNDPHAHWLRIGDDWLHEDEGEEPDELELLQRDYEELETVYRALLDNHIAYKKKAEQWRRQLGAANARERRLKQHVKDLERESANLTVLAAEYRAKFEDLMGDPMGQLDGLTEGRAS